MHGWSAHYGNDGLTERQTLAALVGSGVFWFVEVTRNGGDLTYTLTIYQGKIRLLGDTRSEREKIGRMGQKWRRGLKDILGCGT